MRNELEYIFTNVNNWLKYAEAKSATLLAANGLVLFQTLKFSIKTQLSDCTFIGLIIGSTSLSISLLFCLFSFVPSLKLPISHRKRIPENKDNLVFFHHIENYSPSMYLDKLQSSMELVEEKYSPYDLMLAEQIIVNSAIASYKFAIFKFSIWLSLIGFSILTTSMLTLIFGK